MSIKENVQAIKEELNNEEKIFQSSVQLEYFYKKYKKLIWAVVIAVVAYFLITSIQTMQNGTRVLEANEAFTTLMDKGDDAKALKTLEANSPALFDLYRFQKAMKESDVEMFKQLRTSKAFALADMASYQYAVLSDDTKALDTYIAKEGLYFKDIAILNAAAKLLKQSKIKEAHKLLAQIKDSSPFVDQAQLLRHYGIAK